MINTNEGIRRVRNLINNECIIRVPKGSKELPALAGQGYYTWQFYLRRALLDATCLQIVGEDFWNKNEDFYLKNRFQLAGVESAAIPLIITIILEGFKRGHSVNAFTIRKNRKEYGLRNLIEGCPNGDQVFFIDDLTSPQHNAFWHALNAISVHGLKFNGIGYVLVSKTKEDDPNIIDTSHGKIVIQSLFTLSDFELTYEEYKAANIE